MAEKTLVSEPVVSEFVPSAMIESTPQVNATPSKK